MESHHRPLGFNQLLCCLSYRSVLVERVGVEPTRPIWVPGLQPGYLASECLSGVGADGEPRTHNLLFTRQLLCHIELHQHKKPRWFLEPTGVSAGSTPGRFACRAFRNTSSGRLGYRRSKIHGARVTKVERIKRHHCRQTGQAYVAVGAGIEMHALSSGDGGVELANACIHSEGEYTQLLPRVNTKVNRSCEKVNSLMCARISWCAWAWLHEQTSASSPVWIPGAPSDRVRRP